MILDMTGELHTKRMEMLDRIHELEAYLGKINGTVIDCTNCLNKDCCDVYNSDLGDSET